ncbi:MAG: hypothetical protein V1725_07735 [archaeon]
MPVCILDEDYWIGHAINEYFFYAHFEFELDSYNKNRAFPNACVVGNTAEQFYVEFMPISRNFLPKAMRIGSLGLHCLQKRKMISFYNPESKLFHPEYVLDVLEEEGTSPEQAMADYAAWVERVTEGYRPVEAAAPIKFDGMFTTWYFDNFLGRNPFGHSGEDMSSFYRGVMRNVKARLHDIGVKDVRKQPHNALDDAVQQAKEFEKILTMLRRG